MTESERGRAFLRSESSLSKGRSGNTKIMHGPGGAGRQSGAIGVNSDPRLVLEVYGFLLHWGKDYSDICRRYTS